MRFTQGGPVNLSRPPNVRSMNFNLSRENRWSEMMAKMNEKPKVPIRLLIAFLSILATGFTSASRANFNLIIDPILISPNISIVHHPEFPNNKQTQVPIKLTPESYYYYWSPSERFAIQTAYYYGYAIVNVAFGRLCERFNVARIITIAQMVSTVLTFLTPISVHGGPIVIFILQFTHGVAHGPVLVGIYILVARWFPKKELGSVLSLIFASVSLGHALTIPLSVYLCHPTSHSSSSSPLSISSNLYDWPAVYYFLAGANLIFIVFWWLLTSPDPASHRWISEYELRLIQKESTSNQRRKITKVNWYKLLSSKKVWSVTLVQGAWSFGYLLITSFIPTYLRFICYFIGWTNQWITFYLLIALIVIMVISGPLADWIIVKKIVHVSTTRKVFETATLLIPAICFIFMTLLSNDKTSILILLTFIMLSLGLRTGGDIPMISELTPDLVGTVFGITNTAAALSGITVPAIVNSILNSKETDDYRWNMIFLITSCILILGWFHFVIFSSSTPQPWGIAANRSQSIATVVSIEMPEVSRFRLWFERKKKRISQATLVFKY